jgi:hypothetical protein
LSAPSLSTASRHGLLTLTLSGHPHLLQKEQLPLAHPFFASTMPSRPTSLRIPRSLSVSLSRRALATLPPPLPASLPPSVATIKPLLSAIRETILRADELLKKESLWVDRLDGAAQKLESMDGVEIAGTLSFQLLLLDALRKGRNEPDSLFLVLSLDSLRS